MSATTFGWLILAFPLAGTITIGLTFKLLSARTAGWIGTGAIALAFLSAIGALVKLLEFPAEEQHLTDTLYDYGGAAGIPFDLGILVDPLSVFMALVVSGVSMMIHVYSVGYMGGDHGYHRFFAYLNFFVFSMLLLVLAGNFVLLIVGWAFVGYASYALVSFWYRRDTATTAGMKAFVINVIGDIGLVFAAILLIKELGVTEYLAVFEQAPEHFTTNEWTIVAICLLLLVGAFAKSAQIPFHTWLPDAMEGPTPVSALIHAATMVTAGVYMIVRCNVLYELAPIAGDIVAVTGAATLLMAATIALVQEDIKRVLAWSTVSQIGYMIMGAGLGVYDGAMFHFLTHAFFKALLFLSVGIAIHALAGEQSLDRMGGLRRHLRLTHVAVLVGCLAIAGIPPFSGFFSKDEILATAADAGTLGVICATVGVLGAGLTAFYMFRLFFRAFWGPEPAGGYAHAPHEAGWAMSLPVVILSIGAATAGFLQVPGGWHLVTDWLEPTILADPGLEPTTSAEWLVSIVSVSLAVVAIALAWWVFVADPERRLRLAGTAPGTRTLLADQYRFDEVYEEALIQPGRDLGDVLTDPVERYGVQGTVEGVVRGVIDTGRGLRVVQTGLVRSYAFAMVAGVVAVGIIFSLAVR
ncbi:MAG: NADH-quinone oxidoreductase subunit L [Solirubrobacterales bacterium]